MPRARRSCTRRGGTSRLAHIAEPSELAIHAALYFEAADQRDAISTLAAPLVRRLALDAEVHDLEVVHLRREVREAVLTIKEQFSGGATRSVKQDLGFRGGNMSGTPHWAAPLGMWSLYTKGEGAYLNLFGRDYPDPSRALQITVQATVPFEGVNREVGAAIGRDRETGRRYLVHRGKIGGGRQGIGVDLFWSRFRGGTFMREAERGDPARVVIMGEVGASTLPRDVAAFVHEVGRIKSAGA